MSSAISLEKVSKIFKDGLTRKSKTAIEDLTLEVKEGEIFGFLGPNGAGKSTAIKILLNLIYPTSGRARLLGAEVGDPRVRRRIGYLPEFPYLYDYLTVQELLWFGGRVSGQSRQQIADRSAFLLDLLDLVEAKDRPIRTYSKGMLQRAGLCLALIHDPEVAILDEPMTGLDPLGRRLVADVIRKLRAEGKTVFFSSHILSDVVDLCDRVAILVDGRLKQLLEIQEIKLAAPRGWRVVVDQLSPGLREFVVQQGAAVSGHNSCQEIRWVQNDVYGLLDRVRNENQKLILLEPLQETLEEIFLREIEKSRNRGM